MRRGRDALAALGFLLPNVTGFLVFTAGPVLFSLLASFTDWNLARPGAQWIGARNYSEMAADPRFWTYLANTIYLMVGLPVAIFGSLALAVLLHHKLPGLSAYRTLLYLPSFTAGVALMIVWKSLYNPEFGPINAFLRALLDTIGLGRSAKPPDWLLSTRNLIGLDPERLRLTGAQVGLGARDALVIMGVWVAIGGGNMLLYLAALTNVPEELTEAASLDGAGGWARFWSVVWPQLAPTTFFIVVMSFIGGLQGGFDQARVMTGGGPAGTTTTLAYAIYTKAFEEFEIGYASAISWTLFALVFFVTLVNWRSGNRAQEWV